MPVAAHDLAAIFGAVLLAAIGGEAFLKSILGSAARLHVPRAVMATTLAAFATSSPELTVSTVAALGGAPEIGLGDALGSNVFNIALVFGLALLFGPIQVSREETGRDFILALVIPVLTLALAMDGQIARLEGALLLLIFMVWLGLNVRTALLHRGAHMHLPEVIASSGVQGGGALRMLILGLFGFFAMVTAGRLFVLGATGVAHALSIDTYVIGVLIVAIGTSLPELVTVLLARFRGHDDVGVGTLIGSNLFNGLAIVGLAASIHPIHVLPAELAVAVICGVAALLLLMTRSGTILRWRGVCLLALYAGFVAATLSVGSSSMSVTG